MKIIAIDSSGAACSTALWEDGVVVAQALLQNGNTHSVNLMPMLESMLASCGRDVSCADYIACVTGPGSFTGVRIGVSSVRAVCAALEIPCIAVNALEALSQRSFAGVICPMLDARRSQVYCAAFSAGERLLKDAAVPVIEFLENVKKLKGPYFFTGDGAEAYEDIIRSEMGGEAEGVFIANENERCVSAADAAVLASKRVNEAILRHELMPYYLRAPQAEREYAEKHGQ